MSDAYDQAPTDKSPELQAKLAALDAALSR